jgi:predicted nucleic acid-binding protein
VDELEEVLVRKLGFDQDGIRAVRRLLDRVATIDPRRPKRVRAVTGDPDDDRILASAVEAGARVLVTGDRRHLLPLLEHRGVRLLTPQALLAELRADES